MTGQISSPMAPTTTLVPTPNWSVFDFFRWNWAMWGDWRLSKATSHHARPLAALKMLINYGRSSPRRKKLKIVEHAIAQITAALELSVVARWALIHRRIAGVIGSLTRCLWGPFWWRILLIPAWTLLRIGSDALSLGSGRRG